MIKAKITNQFGAALERELPLDIHQFYHDMREAGINKPPRNILLHDDKGVDLHLSADSEIGSRLLRVFSKGDTLADANTVAFAVSTAREEILTDLEQNIIHNQYLTKEMLFDDIQAMAQAAGPVKLAFYCPLVGQLDDGECDEDIDVGSGFLTAYQDQIEQGIANEQAPEMGDMAQYMGGNFCCLKMFPASYRMTAVGRLRPSSVRWMNWGTMSRGKCLTARISAFPSPARECILSDILEENVPAKYFLSQAQMERLLSKSYQGRKGVGCTLPAESPSP